jgi:hypothetical protein
MALCENFMGTILQSVRSLGHGLHGQSSKAPTSAEFNRNPQSNVAENGETQGVVQKKFTHI